MTRKDTREIGFLGSFRCREQPLDSALAREEDAIGQDHAEVGVVVARHTAGVLHLDPIGESAGNHQEVRIYDRRAVVRDSIDVLLPLTADTVGSDPLNEHLPPLLSVRFRNANASQVGRALDRSPVW
jgi:hypothetical protein